jgi:hypothetical protein
MSREKAMKAANLIADDFTVGFFDHRMVENVAGRIEEVYNDLEGEMTLRDYFAAKAIPALIPELIKNHHAMESAVEIAYEVADAMLKARGNNERNNT